MVNLNINLNGIKVKFQSISPTKLYLNEFIKNKKNYYLLNKIMWIDYSGKKAEIRINLVYIIFNTERDR